MTSVVILVTKDDVENLSISAKAKSCILKYISCRRFLANPQEAVAASRPARTPKSRENIAIMTNMSPYFKIGVIELPLMESMTIAITRGKKHSIITSTVTNSGEAREAFLYCRTLFSKVFIIISLLFCFVARYTLRRKREDKSLQTYVLCVFYI